MKGIRHIGWLLLAVCLLAGCDIYPVGVRRGDIRLSMRSFDATIDTRVEVFFIFYTLI